MCTHVLCMHAVLLCACHIWVVECFDWLIYVIFYSASYLLQQHQNSLGIMSTFPTYGMHCPNLWLSGINGMEWGNGLGQNLSTCT